MLWLVYFESANYAGGGEWRLVEAETDDQAREIIEPIAEEHYWDEDHEQLEEEGYDLDDCGFATIVYVDELTPDHPSWDIRDSFEKVN